MIEPGEPIQPHVSVMHHVAWTGEKSPFGVPHVYPEWFYRDAVPNGVTWERTDHHGVRWTLGMVWKVSDHSGPGHTTRVHLRENHWKLTDTARGWKIDIGPMSVHRTRGLPWNGFVSDGLTDGQALGIADRIIRNIGNYEQMVKGHPPRVSLADVPDRWEDPV